MDSTTLGRTYTGHNGRVYRPSMFLTLTLPSYGRVHTDAGTPPTRTGTTTPAPPGTRSPSAG
jgi:hypothetical protein